MTRRGKPRISCRRWSWPRLAFKPSAQATRTARQSNVERVMEELLRNARADRAWRRRGLLLICASIACAHDGRARSRTSQSGSRACTWRRRAVSGNRGVSVRGTTEQPQASCESLPPMRRERMLETNADRERRSSTTSAMLFIKYCTLDQRGGCLLTDLSREKRGESSRDITLVNIHTCVVASQ